MNSAPVKPFLPYEDVQNVPKRINAKRNRALNISNTVVIEEKNYEFIRINFFKDSVSAIIPKQFGQMSSDDAKLKYPSEYRPQLIYTNDDGSINIAFNLLDYPLLKSQIEESVSEYKTAIKRTNPAYVFFAQKVETLKGRTIGYFDFKSYALDQDVYNLIFITSVKDKLLLGVFNCPFEQYKDWKRLAVRMILSIQDEA